MSWFNNEETTEIWKLYQAGVKHHNAKEMYSDAERNYNFYYDEQWKGVFKKSKKTALPSKNIIEPIVDHKAAMVAMNITAIVFTAMTGNAIAADVARFKTDFCRRMWERLKMDTAKWDIITRGASVGDAWSYLFVDKLADTVTRQDINIKHRIVNNTNIYLSDEQNPNINEQEWIIIEERFPVQYVRNKAKENGIEDIDQIVSDEETSTQTGSSKNDEVKSDLGKCTSLLFMRLKDNKLEHCRATKTVVYEPMQTLPIPRYPLAVFRWKSRVGSARGVSEISGLIGNQLVINECLARNNIATQNFTYPTPVYDKQKVQNVEELSMVGGMIAVDNLGNNPVGDLITYLQPPQISSWAFTFPKELAEDTQKLKGTNDATLGNINPEQASGEAIKAQRDQAAIPLNHQTQNFQQYVEDIALIMADLLTAYSVNGIVGGTNEDGEEIIITQDVLRATETDLKIDISPVDPLSTTAQEVSIGNLFHSPLIQNTPLLKEYTAMLDDTSIIPKGKLEALIESRETLERQAMQQQAMQPPETLLQGGMPVEMPQMPM